MEFTCSLSLPDGRTALLRPPDGICGKCGARTSLVQLQTQTYSSSLDRRVGPGNFTPSPSQNSGLEPLDSSGSCHPIRAAALRQNRRAPPVASWPIMAPTWIAYPLRSTDVTPLLCYCEVVRPSASHPYFRPRGSSHLWLLRYHRRQGSHVPN